MRKMFIAGFIIAALSVSALAQSSEVIVGDIDLSNLKWGEQKVTAKLTNKTDFPKYISVVARVEFEGTYLNPSNGRRTNHLLYPNDTMTIEPTIYVPGNYGKAKVVIEMYDVVDTLDFISESMKFFEQPFSMNYHLPDAIIPYLQERITLPPRIEEHPLFEGEISRLLLVWIEDDWDVADMAKTAACDQSFILSSLQNLTDEKYIFKSGTRYELRFPLIRLKEAEEVKLISQQMAEQLAVQIADNLQGYQGVLDSLVASKAISRDSSEFVSGSSLLYKPTPIVSSFLLWQKLGSDFINKGTTLQIFVGTDICNADNAQYRYAVEGGAHFNGSHFYSHRKGKKKSTMMFSEQPPEIVCADNFTESKRRGSKGVWNYAFQKYPEYFVMDTANIRPFINLLSKDIDPILKKYQTEIETIAANYNHYRNQKGYHYWFWNLVATATLNNLFESGALPKRGNGYYRFETLKKQTHDH